jgi:hypothetical protein
MGLGPPALRPFAFLLMAAMLACTGCAGLQAKESGPPSAKSPLGAEVYESFKFGIQDPKVKAYLQKVDPSMLPQDDRIEVLILHAISQCKEEKDLAPAFDRLWSESEDIRALLQNPDQGPASGRPLSELYYLLSGSPAASWRTKTGETIYQSVLASLEPHALSGYALHFYTQGLIRNDKWDKSIPLLQRLALFTPPQVHTQNLSFALEHAIQAREHAAVCRLLAMVCEQAGDGQGAFPAAVVKRATELMLSAGKIQLVRDAITPVLAHRPDLRQYEFLRDLEDGAQPPEHEQEREGGIQGQMALSNHSEVTETLRIDVQVIEASRESNSIDPALQDLDGSLKDTLRYTGFSLLKQRTLYLHLGEEAEVAFRKDQRLVIVPRSFGNDVARVEIAVVKNDSEVFRSVIESVSGGSTTIGDPKGGNRMLLLRITTHGPKAKHPVVSVANRIPEAKKWIPFFDSLC